MDPVLEDAEEALLEEPPADEPLAESETPAGEGLAGSRSSEQGRSRSRSRSPHGGPKDFDSWVKAVNEDWKRFRDAPEELRGNPDLLCECMRLSGGEALKYASEALRSDREFVLGAAQEMGAEVLGHASASLRADREFMLEVVDWCSPGEVLNMVSDSLRVELLGDREFVLETMKQVGSEILCHISEELRGNREFMLSVADFGPPGEVLEYATDKLRTELYSDGAFMLQTMKGVGVEVLEYASPKLKADRNFVLKALKSAGPEALEYASEELRANREFMIAASRGVGPEMPAVLRDMVDMDPNVDSEDYWVEGDDGGGFWDIEGILSDYRLLCKEQGKAMDDGDNGNPATETNGVMTKDAADEKVTDPIARSNADDKTSKVDGEQGPLILVKPWQTR